MSKTKTTKQSKAAKTTMPAATPPVVAAKTKPETKPVETTKPKQTLRKPQLRILAALSKSKTPMSRKDISTAAPVDQACCVEYIGSPDDAIRKANDLKHFPSLVSLGFVKQAIGDGPAVYSITAKGKTALAAQ